MPKILNLARLEKKLRRLPQVAEREIKAAMEAAADDIVALARSLAPEEDGDLKKSIGWTWGTAPRGSITLGSVVAAALGKDLTLTVYAGDSTAFYARWVEFGTAPHLNRGLFAGTQHPGTAAQPFFFPAYRANRKGAKARIRRATRAAGRKVAAGG